MENLVFEVETLNTNSDFDECEITNFHDSNSSQAICLNSGMKLGLDGDTTVKVENV